MVIRCVVYKDGRKFADIQPHEIHDYLNQPGCLVWVALRDPDDATLDEMRRQFGLHPLAVEDAQHGHQRPKIEEYGDSLFAVLRTIEPDGPDLRIGEVDVFAGVNYVLSVRTNSQRGFEDVRARCEREPDLMKLGSGYVLYALTDAVVDRYFPVLEQIEDELETIEEQVFANRSPRSNFEALYGLKRKLTLIKHCIAPLTESMTNLSGARTPVLCSGLRDYFRDIYDHLLRLNQTADSVRDMVASATSINLALINLQENETMKRLAAYAALVAVPTMIAGIYGMNFVHMPELSWRYGYAAVMGVMAALDGYLFYRLRKARWL